MYNIGSRYRAAAGEDVEDFMGSAVQLFVECEGCL
jgi:hypothetical protein